MKNSILFLIVHIFVITACAQKEYKLSEEMIYHISIDETKNVVQNFNNIIEEYKYVPLQKKEGFVIGKIEQVLTTVDKILVSISDGIYCYDFEGNPIYNITNKGHARNEFIHKKDS